MKIKSRVLFIAFCVFQIVCHAQSEVNAFKSLKFRQYSLKDGLSQNSVLAIKQDRDGFLWFGTRDGLNKYDGREFQTFRHSSQDSTSLSHSLIKSIYEDNNKNLWIGTIDGLNKYNPNSNSFDRFYFETTDTYENNEIWCITQADSSSLWIGTSSGLKKLNLNNEKFVSFDFNPKDNSFFKSPIRALLKVNESELWIKTAEQIGFFNVLNGVVKYYNYPENSPKELNKNNVSTLYQDESKNIWLGFKNGLALLNKKTDAFEFFKSKSESAEYLSDVRSIQEDDSGNLWVGTYRGLYLINSKTFSISHYVHDENNPNSLSQNSIYDIYEDEKGDMWVGTYAGGISYFERSFDVFKHFASGANNTKLNYNVVSSIVQDSQNNLWVGTEGGGINYYDASIGEFSYYMNEPNNSNGLSANNVKAIIQDKKGGFWIGTHEGGLNYLKSTTKPLKFQIYKTNSNDKNSISDNRVISLLEDTYGDIWIGTSGGGINVLDRQTDSIYRLQDPKDWVGKIVYTIYETSNENKLLIGGNIGLCEVDIKTRKLSKINYLGSNPETHTIRAVLCVYEDEKGNVFIGTEGDGLYYYDRKTKTSTKYGTQQGLPNDIIYGIIPDDEHNIWLSTNNGLSRINTQTLEIKNFNAQDGLQSNEFNFGAYLKNKNGELFFGGANGFNVFNPKDIKQNTYEPPVSITSMQVNNKPFLSITDNIKEVSLKYDQNIFNLDFIALSYSQPLKNQYAYKLEGFDKDWNYIGNKTSATYTNIDAGTYTFKVKASNNDGLWNEIGDSITIDVLPAPWFTWWAYLLYFLLAFEIFWQIRKYSLIRVKERNELKQERLEKERIEEVNKLKLQLFTNISHDFRTPLTLIIGPLERLLKMDDGNDFIRKQHDIMYRNASILMELINQLLDFRKNESGKLSLKASENNIVPFLRDIKQAFNELAEVKNIDYRFISTDEIINVWYDKTQLKKVVFNLLSNAFKFTPEEGSIELQVSEVSKYRNESEKKYVKIEVIDNGEGIPKKHVKFIFDRYYQLGERTGTGIGLALSKNLVELHKGEIKVKSKKEKGTTFKVLLPLGKDHLIKDQIEKPTDAVKLEEDYSIEKSVYVDKELLTINEETQKGNVLNASLATILIVEDNYEVRGFVKSIFEKSYNIFEAPNGKKAIEIAKKQDVDLIISDIMMPEMDGMELCEIIKTNINTSHIPVILLTAKTSQEFQKAGFSTGADAYVTKPFDAEILELRVENILASRKNLIHKFKKDVILQPKEITVTSADELFLQKAIDLVEENITNSEFTIQDFIEGMGMSRSVLYRKLKALTDQSTSEFIRTIKLKRAAQLIEQTQMTISEIAFDLGFNDLKNFRTSFQKLFDKLPSDFRNPK
ncbi:hybrid sensor histidine kinase/response regulator transcription factor [Aestuariibaculum suncheonense]|uniref:histidine kinase n=1 Tax=Aestuariibaculum suncheonense TaxID=1028745 RepID=A0A8J6QF43_9FLAO|nr:hybrid sensor histidine kinase/response regulator transcription factor [Aestuariibaculum suncheonense]MBD0835683.1 response regulator [Aestuariibaculum suncheonense]